MHKKYYYWFIKKGPLPLIEIPIQIVISKQEWAGNLFRDSATVSSGPGRLKSLKTKILAGKMKKAVGSLIIIDGPDAK